MEIKGLVITIDQQGSAVREEHGEYEGRKFVRRFQVGRMDVETKDGPMQQPVRVQLWRDESGYKPGEYVVASSSFERDTRTGNLKFNRLQLAPLRAAAVQPVPKSA